MGAKRAEVGVPHVFRNLDHWILRPKRPTSKIFGTQMTFLANLPFCPWALHGAKIGAVGVTHVFRNLHHWILRPKKPTSQIFGTQMTFLAYLPSWGQHWGSWYASKFWKVAPLNSTSPHGGANVFRRLYDHLCCFGNCHSVSNLSEFQFYSFSKISRNFINDVATGWRQCVLASLGP